MHPRKLPVWLQNIVAMGGVGMFVVAFLDSSVLSFPFVTDALVIQLSLANPIRMPYYAAMAAVGSLSGCIWLYLLAKKGGEAFFHRHARGKAEKVKEWGGSEWISQCVYSGDSSAARSVQTVCFSGRSVSSADADFCPRDIARAWAALWHRRNSRRALRRCSICSSLMTHSRVFVLAVLGILALLYLATHITFRKPSGQ